MPKPRGLLITEIKSEGLKWIQTAQKIFDSSKTGWFDRALYQFGWLKKKPAPAVDPFF